MTVVKKERADRVKIERDTQGKWSPKGLKDLGKGEIKECGKMSPI